MAEASFNSLTKAMQEKVAFIENAPLPTQKERSFREHLLVFAPRSWACGQFLQYMAKHHSDWQISKTDARQDNVLQVRAALDQLKPTAVISVPERLPIPA